MIWSHNLKNRHVKKAAERGLVLLEPVDYVRAKYRWPCGCEQVLCVSYVNRSQPGMVCQWCKSERTVRRKLAKHGLSLVKYLSSEKAVAACHRGHERNVRPFRKSQPECPECKKLEIEVKWSEEADALGITFIRRLGMHKSLYALPCGHTQVRSPQNIRKGRFPVCLVCEPDYGKPACSVPKAELWFYKKLAKGWHLRTKDGPHTKVSVVECNVCGDGFINVIDGRGRVKSVCSDECKKRQANKIRNRHRRAQRRKGLYERGTVRKRVKNKSRFDSGITAVTVAQRDGWVCQECGGKVVRHPGGYLANGATVGHIMPLAHNGTHTWDNVQCECHSCNTKKGADIPDSVDNLVVGF